MEGTLNFGDIDFGQAGQLSLFYNSSMNGGALTDIGFLKWVKGNFSKVSDMFLEARF